jgi:hypothetical protein
VQDSWAEYEKEAMQLEGNQAGSIDNGRWRRRASTCEAKVGKGEYEREQNDPDFSHPARQKTR